MTYAVTKYEDGHYVLSVIDYHLKDETIVRSFDHYPAEEEVEASLSMRKLGDRNG